MTRAVLYRHVALQCDFKVDRKMSKWGINLKYESFGGIRPYCFEYIFKDRLNVVYNDLILNLECDINDVDIVTNLKGCKQCDNYEKKKDKEKGNWLFQSNAAVISYSVALQVVNSHQMSTTLSKSLSVSNMQNRDLTSHVYTEKSVLFLQAMSGFYLFAFRPCKSYPSSSFP